MAFKQGEKYRCPDPECGCEIKVTKGAAPGKGGNQNPRRCCGKRCRRSCNDKRSVRAPSFQKSTNVCGKELLEKHTDKVGVAGTIFAALCCLGFPALLSILGTVGLGFLINDAILVPLLALFLIVTLRRPLSWRSTSQALARVHHRHRERDRAFRFHRDRIQQTARLPRRRWPDRRQRSQCLVADKSE
jgi:hypothetical protein